MYNILIIHYSQTGQLTKILENISKEMNPDKCRIDFVNYNSKEEFTFPWSKEAFFNVFPECVLNLAQSAEDIALDNQRYDLVILGYQPWYLSPSIPAMEILKNQSFKNTIKNTPVVTVIGARNMWINAQKEVKLKIKEAGGNLVGNIPLIDNNNNLLSAISIMHWMFTGKKTKKWGLFPKPGIKEEDIASSEKYGPLLLEALEKDQLDQLQNNVLALGMINIRWPILFIESRAKKLFLIWAKLILKKGTSPARRKRWLTIFKYYLIFALFIVSPIVLFIYAVFFRWFFLKKENAEKRLTLSNN